MWGGTNALMHCDVVVSFKRGHDYLAGQPFIASWGSRRDNLISRANSSLVITEIAAYFGSFPECSNMLFAIRYSWT